MNYIYGEQTAPSQADMTSRQILEELRSINEPDNGYIAKIEDNTRQNH